MTVKNFFETHTIEEIAEYVAHGIYDEQICTDDWRSAFQSEFFPDGTECYGKHCEYLIEGQMYEDDWMNGMCCLQPNDVCPCGVSRREVFKKELVEWFNTEINKAES